MPFFVPLEIDISYPNLSWADILGDRCSPGYTRYNNMCVKDGYPEIRYKIPETIGYDFKYYQNGGELVGKYKLYTCSQNMVPQYLDQPVYVLTGQPAAVDFPTSTPSTFIDQSEGYLVFTTNDSGDLGGTGLPFGSSETWDVETGGYEYITFGQFFLLNNHPSAIKMFNLNYDIVYNSGGTKYIDRAVVPHNSFGTNPDAFIQWQIGISRVQNSDRPYNMMGKLYPSTRYPVSGTETLYDWNQVGDDCTRWFDIFDYDSLNEYWGDEVLLAVNGDDSLDLEGTMANLIPNLQNVVSTMPAGQYVLNIRARIDKDKLMTFLGSGAVPELAGIDFDIQLYPPSMYIFPSDRIVGAISPASNKVNKSIEHIIFALPNNYKMDGNFQFRIQFLDESERLIQKANALYEKENASTPTFEDYMNFVPSNVIYEAISYVGEFNYSDFITTDDYEYVVFKTPDGAVFELDKWSYSFDLLEWKSMADIGGVIPVIPKFANTDYEGYGVSSEDNIYIKYTLSDEARDIILNRSDIIYRIILIDGTLL